MILSVSGRCDIPAFYMEWFIKRIKAGYVDVRNPFYPQMISRIMLDKEHIEAIIFCTKNPLAIYNNLATLTVFPIMVQVTLTPYRKDIEPNVIDKHLVIDGVIRLSTVLGKQCIAVRYDPIILNDTYTLQYHELMFTRLCEQLSEYVSCIIISFVDIYKNTKKHMDVYAIHELNETEIIDIAKVFGAIAKKYNVRVQTCAEKIDLMAYGISSSPCISEQTMFDLTSRAKRHGKTKNRNCQCVETVDIGYYNMCSHFCRYCYANYDEARVRENMQNHDVNSSLLMGHITESDIITVRKK